VPCYNNLRAIKCASDILPGNRWRNRRPLLKQIVVQGLVVTSIFTSPETIPAATGLPRFCNLTMEPWEIFSPEFVLGYAVPKCRNKIR
jgi:hypothetical protein